MGSKESTVLIESTVSVYDEYYDDCPDKAVITLDHQTVKKLIKLEKYVGILKVNSISDYDCRLEFFVDDEDSDTGSRELDFNVECEKYRVYEGSVCWGGIIKHTSIHWETDSISMNLLKELDKVWGASLKELPSFIGNVEYPESTQLLTKRMEALC